MSRATRSARRASPERPAPDRAFWLGKDWARKERDVRKTLLFVYPCLYVCAVRLCRAASLNALKPWPLPSAHAQRKRCGVESQCVSLCGPRRLTPSRAGFEIYVKMVFLYRYHDLFYIFIRGPSATAEPECCPCPASLRTAATGASPPQRPRRRPRTRSPRRCTSRAATRRPCAAPARAGTRHGNARRLHAHKVGQAISPPKLGRSLAGH